MRDFDFYEFACILTPGAITVAGIALVYRQTTVIGAIDSFSAGDFGLFLVVSYAAGHVIQAVGNMVEYLFWRACGGWPTDWIRSGKRFLISERLDSVVKRSFDSLRETENDHESQMTEVDWKAEVQLIRSSLMEAGRAGRLSALNGNYGINRGLASALFVLLICVVFTYGFRQWQAELGLLAGFCLVLYRMHRFGTNYARELYTQYLSLQSIHGNV